VTTTLLKLATVVGVNVMVIFPLLVAAFAGGAEANWRATAAKLGVISGRDPVVVVSMTALAVIVAAAKVVAACGALGFMMLVTVKVTAVPAVSAKPVAVNVTVNTPLTRAGEPVGVVPPTPVISPTTMVLPETCVNPVSVTTTLLKLATVVGVNVMVIFPLLVAAFAGGAEANWRATDPKLGVTASRDPVAVVSKTVLPAIVAAAMVVDAACGALGLMMLVTVKDAAVPAVSTPAVKVTVNTPPLTAAVAAGLPVMVAEKSATAMVAVEVNPVSVTTTMLKLVTVVGVNVMVTFPLLLPTADAGLPLAKATLTDLSDAVTACTEAVVVESSTVVPANVARPVVDAAAKGPFFKFANVIATLAPIVN